MHRVLHVISGLGAGGAQRVLARLIVAGDRAWTHEVVSLVDAPGVRIDGAAHVPAHGLGLSGLSGLIRSLGELRKIARRFRPTVIQGWMYHGNLAALLCRLGSAAPVIWNVRHSPEGEAHQKASTRAVVKINALLSGITTAVVFNSVRSAGMHERLGFAAQRTRIIPNGFDTAHFAPDRQRGLSWRKGHGIPANARVFGHAARLHEIKNHQGALEAFVESAARSDAWMVMVGEGVDKSPSLLELARSSQCRGRVLLIGNERDMTAFYNAIDVLLLSSWAEAMPNVIGEAMACGIPCISTDVGDAAVLIADTGWIARAVTRESMADAMNVAAQLDERELRARGEAARARIEGQFSLSKMVAQYAQLYDAAGAAPARALPSSR